MTAIFGGLFGLACITSIVALLIQVVPPKDDRSGAKASAAASGAASAQAPPSLASRKKKRTPIPGPWRVAELEKDASVSLVSGHMEKKSFVDALSDKGVPTSQVYRILKAMEEIRKFDKTGRHDKFTVALEKATKRVKAFEYEASPSDVVQARENDQGLLVGQKLDMKIAEDEAIGAFYVGSDVKESAAWGGFEDGILAAIDEAFNGRISHESFEEGSVVKVIAVEETALGLFSKYKRIVAVEYRPKDPSAPPVRAYAFNGEQSKGYWDEKGKQPYSGGWQSPLAGGMVVVSPFNPHRMHPVLHKIMPHEGTDLRAAMGTPVYAAYHGVVKSAGPLGPCGNAVVIDHPNGIETGYCHLSKIAPDMKPGEHVGVHELVGLSGMSGRATGPHLHFFAKKDGKFFDAMTLKLNGERVVPPVDRPAFAAAKAELDKRLEAIPLPEPPPERPKVVAAASSTARAAEASGKADKGGD
ncbi:MAG TPA: M23 family metallopeptidase, partial [Minicystis sp.]|nr:M23 family metallopeptidase [Minicystis sp.]